MNIRAYITKNDKKKRSAQIKDLHDLLRMALRSPAVCEGKETLSVLVPLKVREQIFSDLIDFDIDYQYLSLGYSFTIVGLKFFVQ
jgi:hypothetical protein